jgi:hypothetical protein
MAHFLIETIATVKHMYLIDAEDEDSAVEKYLESENTPTMTNFVGELIDVVDEICCEDHYQELLNISKEQPTISLSKSNTIN